MTGRMGITGGIAGMLAALAFALVHALMINEIWFSLPMLLVAGALCGSCLGATYGMLRKTPSLGSWVGYNALFVSFFALIAVASEITYEPVITLAEVIANGPPSYLWEKTIPLVGTYILLMAAVLYSIYGRSRKQFLALLGTSAILVLLLGLNVSLMGLVFAPAQSYYMIAETFGLILVLNLIFSVSFAGLEWKRLTAASSPGLPLFRQSKADIAKEDRLQ